jgi:hypothetical protein
MSEMQVGRLERRSRLVEGICSRTGAYRGFQGSKVPRLVFARASFSGASVSGQPLPNLIHPLSATNSTTRHTPIRTTLATRAPFIATERALHRLVIRRHDCIAFWEDCQGIGTGLCGSGTVRRHGPTQQQQRRAIATAEQPRCL